MELLNLNTLLFLGKWLLIGLVYLILIIMVIAVRREMKPQRVSTFSSARLPATEAHMFGPGALRVLSAGSDPRVRRGAILPLKPETHLGAGTDNDLILDDRFVSGRHATLQWDGFTWWVVDLESSNGTFIDGRMCPAHAPQRLDPGSRLQLGDMEFEIVIPQA